MLSATNTHTHLSLASVSASKAYKFNTLTDTNKYVPKSRHCLSDPTNRDCYGQNLREYICASIAN